MPPHPNIRRAGHGDAEAIAVVHVRSWRAAYRGLVPQGFLDAMDLAERRTAWQGQLAETSWPRQGILIAEINGDVAGFAGIRPTRDDDTDPATVAEVAAIYLDPGAWSTGTGTRLMASDRETLAQAGYQQATLWVLDTNARARRFYERDGWHTDGATKCDTTRGFPLKEVRYRRPLGPPDGEAETHR